MGVQRNSPTKMGSGQGGREAGLSSGKCMMVGQEGVWGAAHTRVTPAGES